MTVDSTPPTLALRTPRARCSPAPLNVTADTGAAQATLQVRAAGAARGSTVGAATAARLHHPFDSSTVADGAYDVRASSADASATRRPTRRERARSTTPRRRSTARPRTTARCSRTARRSSLSADRERAAAVGRRTSRSTGIPCSAPRRSIRGTAVTVPLGAPSPTASTPSRASSSTSRQDSSFRINVDDLAPPGSLTQPPIARRTRARRQTTLTSADNSATVFVPAGVCDVPFGHEDDFLVLTGRPGRRRSRRCPAMTMTGSTSSTSRWTGTPGSEEHQFEPARDRLIDPTGGAGRARDLPGRPAWRLIPMIASAGVLPAGQQDGYWRTGATVHVLTRHLTLFTLVARTSSAARVAPPATSPPSSRGDGLTLRWAPGMDRRIQTSSSTSTASPIASSGRPSTRRSSARSPRTTRARSRSPRRHARASRARSPPRCAPCRPSPA